ncbi:hypothetical protein BDQ94DRAFT_178907 [Aspergillus welwitschiae]|uniref:Uncharacterized protein n=1 Tax=Aspergillus welwitschiae TaxID=1341132 RepID=A0A3F3PH27_9EURO|nr:hypothetical protein BDQ94DRAFT_178907 [Aspergillus welwitschiae]RDH26245.1 hypothetical protein BDQ94DRAFT_178907 [Aspergillus welwitschiae]
MEKRNHTRAHPGYWYSPSNKKKRSRTTRARSQGLAVLSMPSSTPGQSSQSNAWSTSLDSDRTSEHSTGSSHAEEGTFTKRNVLHSNGCSPLQSAASVWWQ